MCDINPRPESLSFTTLGKVLSRMIITPEIDNVRHDAHYCISYVISYSMQLLEDPISDPNSKLPTS